MADLAVIANPNASVSSIVAAVSSNANDISSINYRFT